MIYKCYSNIIGTSERICELEEHLNKFIGNKKKNVNVLKDFFSFVKDYKSVKMICLAHTILRKVIVYAEKLNTIGDPVVNRNIIVYHNKVYDAEDFGCQLEMYNTDISGDDYIEVSKALNTIEKNSFGFHSQGSFEIMEDFVENHKVMNEMVQIVEKEEKRDDLIRKVQEGEWSGDPVLREVYRMYRMYVTRKKKRLKNKGYKSHPGVSEE